MTEENPFTDISKKIKTIQIEGKPLKVKPNTRDAEMFILMKKDMNDKDAARITEIMENIIKRANPELSQEDISSGIALHYGTILSELSILFGFTTREDLDKSKKKLETEASKKLES